MNRAFAILLSPEAVLVFITATVFWFCSRHPSGEGHDTEVLGNFVMLLPVLVVPLVFATVFAPGAKNWWWLGRTVLFTAVALGVCANRIINGFGSGAKGQDGAIIWVVTFALILMPIGMAISGAMILAETRPAFAGWFHARPVVGSVLTLLAAVPIGLALGVVVGIGVFVLGFYYELTR
jgi:hypothetical protein